MIKVEESAHLLNRTTSRPLASGVSKVEEGTCLVADYDANGVMHVRPSASTANEIFVGFALTEKTELETLVALDTFTSAAATKETYTLSHSYNTGARMVSGTGLAGVAAAASASAVNAANQWHVSGTTLTVQVAANTTFTLAYRFTPTVVDYRRVQGDIHPGPAVGVSQGVITVLEAGELLFDNYDTTADWQFGDAVDVDLKTGANGRITRGGTGTDIRGIITQQPRAYESAGDAVLLGLSFNV